MNTTKIFSTLVVALAIAVAHAQAPECLVINGQRLAKLRQQWQQKNATVTPAVNQLLQQADSMLAMKPLSVMEKSFLPVSGNRHDYMSQAPYFWYDSSKPSGLPYLRRDGQRNPEIYKITDRSNLGKLETASKTLAMAWYLTHEDKYAAKAATLLNTWFLDTSTKMNPHLDYGQAVPGVNSGRGIGIIETIALTGIADASLLLNGAPSWTAAQQTALQQWYKAYLQWMLTSKNGKEEHAAKNNHGTWYYAQAIDFALFTGQKALAVSLVEESKKRLDSQLTADGKQPLELERTNGLGYSTMNLHGWFTVATLAEKTGNDLWNYHSPNGASLRTALDWLLPYATAKKTWEYQQISKYNAGEDFFPLLLQAAEGFKEPKYLADADGITQAKPAVLSTLLYGN